MIKVLSIAALAILLGISGANAKHIIRHHHGQTLFNANTATEQSQYTHHSEPLNVWGARFYNY